MQRAACRIGPGTLMTRNGRSRPGEPVELDIEIWPTSIVVPTGYRLGLSVRGKDYEYDGTDAALPHAAYPMKGSARSPTPIRSTGRRKFLRRQHAAFRRGPLTLSAAADYSPR